MAEEKQSNNPISAAQGFTGGMVSDPDPRYQIKGSYRDALNVRLINDDGESFSIENIEGNRKFFNLRDISQQHEPGSNGDNPGMLGTKVTGKAGETMAGERFSEIYIDPTSELDGQLVGDYFPSENNTIISSPPVVGPNVHGVVPFKGANALIVTPANAWTWMGVPINYNTPSNYKASIVGYYSYNTHVIFIIVIPKTRNLGSGDLSSQSQDTRTIFLDVEFDNNLNVLSVTDLFVSYNHNNASHYPELNMLMNHPVRVEAIIENECISRIYWTDNINPLRSLNMRQSRKNLMSPDVLDLVPMHTPSQPIVKKTVTGSLPVGQIQYCFKYISSNGGETVMSPFSNLYHTTEKFGDTSTYYGSSSGDTINDVSSHGFQVQIVDLDIDFDTIELYAILHDSKNGAVRVSLVDVQHYIASVGYIDFYHTNWAGDLQDGIDIVLIDDNSWDICKDISIKDNILFAGNLKTRENSISEKEWNVKVRRYNIIDDTGSGITGTITSDDPTIKEYEIDNVLASPTYGNTIVSTPSLGLRWDDYTPKWRTYKGQDRSVSTGNPSCKDYGRVGVEKKQCHEYRYLSDGLTLGGESYDYDANDLGGCRVTFGLKEKVIDIRGNVGTSPFIKASKFEDMQTDNISDDGIIGNITTNSDGDYTATMSVGGSKDPGIGNFIGYRRGEIYRFGVQVYDKKGRPGNVLWIGDIEMPEMNDPLRMLRTDQSTYSPGLETEELLNNHLFKQHVLSQDHRISMLYGHTVPSLDVAWFSGYESTRYVNASAYRHSYIASISVGNINPVVSGNSSNGAGYNVWDAYVDSEGEHTGSLGLGWSSPRYINDNPSIYDPSTRLKQLPFKYDNENHNDKHYSLDLYVNFEFRIPSDVREKISGFRVVRAERTESDKSVIQQGILNQTIAYGSTSLTRGYVQWKQITDEDHPQGTDVISNIIVDSTNYTTHLPYDSYLNGYVGLAENSNLAFPYFDSTLTDGQILRSGAHYINNIRGFPDYEEAQCTGGTDKMDNLITVGQTTAMLATPVGSGYPYINALTARTPGSLNVQKRHSAYFGSYEIIPNSNLANGVPSSNIDYKHPLKGGISLPVQGSVFTIDCPDSAFGLSSYDFRPGDKIRVDALMKLQYDERRKNYTVGLQNFSRGYDNHSGHTSSPLDSALDDYIEGATIFAEKWGYSPATGISHISHCLKYSKYRRVGDWLDNNGALFAKYYIYDTYWGIGMSVDGGKAYANGWNEEMKTDSGVGDPFDGDTNYFPAKHHDIYYHDILEAAEIGPGEVLPGSFFRAGVRVFDVGSMSGFSNNTLGYVEWGYREAQQDSTPTYFSGGNSVLFGCLSSEHNSGNPTDGVSHQIESDTNGSDRTYDTISTMQQGLRTIVLQINGDGGKAGSRRGLLNPRNLSAILENRHWHGVANGVAKGFPTISQGALANQRNTSDDSHLGGRSYIPFKFLCTIYRPSNPYGGASKGAIENTRYIPCGNFHPILKDLSGVSKESHLSSVFGGDTFITLYSHQKTSIPYEERSMARFQMFPVESSVNTDMRMGFHLSAGDMRVGDVTLDDGMTDTNQWEYNDVYSQENNMKSAIMIDEESTCKALNLPYEIAYSETKISGEPSDSFRVFKFANFHGMESEYGEITRLMKFKNELYVLQETSLSKLLVNPISMIADEIGTSLMTGTGDTVENHLYISTKYGTRHMDSVVATENALYYIDNTYGKLLQFNGNELRILSDDLGQRQFFYDMIKNRGDLSSKYKVDRNYISDNTLRFCGITSVFDYSNNELLITLHSSVMDKNPDSDNYGNRTFTERLNKYGFLYKIFDTYSKTIVYSESINAFTSYYSVTPSKWMGIGGYVVSTEYDVTPIDNAYRDPAGIRYNRNWLSTWQWDKQTHGLKTVFFEEQYPALEVAMSSITKVINEIPSVSKVFDNARIIMTPDKVNLTNSLSSFETEIIPSAIISIDNDTAVKYQEGILRFPLRNTTSAGPRQRGTYIKIKYSTRSTNKFNIFAILAKYRKSFN